MKTNLAANMVIRNKNSDKKERILWINRNDNLCYTIDINSNTVVTGRRKVSDILQDIENGIFEIIEEKSSFKMSGDVEKYTNHMEKRHKLVKDLIRDSNIPDIFVKNKRRKIILEVAKNHESSESYLRKLLVKYWQRGMTKYSLLPDWANIGKSKCKDPSELKKLGRKSIALKHGNAKDGVNVGFFTQEAIKISIQGFYYLHKLRTIKDAYMWMLTTFFTIPIIENDELVDSIMPADEIPTIEQYYYWFNKIIDEDEAIRKRLGDKEYLLNHRELLSDSNYEVLGPGERYQIDSTKGNIYLVNAIDQKKVIGRPVIYLAVDVFSRMITGIHISIDDPSWEGMATLLYNCFEDKVEYCKRYGIDIAEEDWPVYGIPQIILADRGEAIGGAVENSIKNLEIEIENTSSYRGDMKGIVEKFFDLFDQYTKSKLPGVIVSDHRKRGEPDYKKNSLLTLSKFTEIMILVTMTLNKRVMDKYPLTADMIRDNVPPIPIELWNWGNNKKTGALRVPPKDLMTYSLLRKGRASITEKGLVFNKVIYLPNDVFNPMSFSKARQNGREGIDVYFDPRNIEKIFTYDISSGIWFSYSINLEKTQNNPYLSSENFGFDITIEDVKKYHESWVADKYTRMNHRNKELLKLNNSIESIVDAEKKNSRKGKVDIKNISENRNTEKEIWRKEQALTKNLEHEGMNNNQVSNTSDSGRDSEGSGMTERDILLNELREWSDEDDQA